MKTARTKDGHGRKPGQDGLPKAVPPIVQGQQGPPGDSNVLAALPVTEKYFLTLQEASQLSGLSPEFLQAQIDKGDLKTLEDGVEKIRRADLKKL